MTASIRPSWLTLLGEVSGLLSAGEIADDDCCTAVDQVGQRGRSASVAGVDDHLVTVGEQGGCSTAAEALGGAGDEDAGHDRGGCSLPG
jgi:hypothetical protein